MDVKAGKARRVVAFRFVLCFPTVKARLIIGFHFGSRFFTVAMRLALGFGFRFSSATTRLAVGFGCAPRFFAARGRLPDGLLDAINAPSCLPIIGMKVARHALCPVAPDLSPILVRRGGLIQAQAIE